MSTPIFSYDYDCIVCYISRLQTNTGKLISPGPASNSRAKIQWKFLKFSLCFCARVWSGSRTYQLPCIVLNFKTLVNSVIRTNCPVCERERLIAFVPMIAVLVVRVAGQVGAANPDAATLNMLLHDAIYRPEFGYCCIPRLLNMNSLCTGPCTVTR